MEPMSTEMAAKLKKSLIAHEGYRTHVYKDTLGNETAGIGYNIGARGLPDKTINELYEEDVEYYRNQLNTFSWFSRLNEDRQIILIDMCFMGWKRFLEFTQMLECLARDDYKGAAFEMLNSEWGHQTKARAVQLSNGMASGTYYV